MNDIKDLLPHRDPFLFVDKVIEASEEKIVAERTFTEAEPFFKGHFPGHPVVPGVVLIETMAQAGGAGIRELGVLGDALFFLATVEKAKFRKQVVPGDTVTLEISNDRISKSMLKQSGKALVNGEVAAEASWLCLVDRSGS
jgi:3-hydroxyacyl-[acyl-carrier-protein] dehydratase